MPFERESFVPVCTSPAFVCTSKDSEIQRGSVFARLLYSELSQFLRYRNDNGIRKRICTCLYLKRFGDTTISKFRKCKRGNQSFLKISKWDQRQSKENRLNRFSCTDSKENWYKRFCFDCRWFHIFKNDFLSWHL